MLKTIEIIDQIYKNHQHTTNSNNSNYSGYHNFISVSNNVEYLDKLRKTSAKVSLFYKMLPYYLPPRAPTFDSNNILQRNIATVDLEELGLTDRQYRYKINKELRKVNLAFHIKDNKYYVNPFIMNNFNKKQFTENLMLFHKISMNKDNELLTELYTQHLNQL